MIFNPQCDPLVNNINSPVGPPLPGLPGFGLDINFPSIPLPNLGIPEDIINWLRRLKFNLPGGGLLQKLVDKLSETVANILSTLLSYLNAAMGWIMFIAAIVEMILCVIKVLCAAPKPFSIVRAVKRLLRKCIPIFISICFPFFVWLLLLLALIAILIALIEYIIAMIVRMIKQIIKNFKRLYNLTFKQRSPNAALAIITKLANLLCLFLSIFEFLSTIFALLDIITGQWAKILKVCDRGTPGGEQDDDVCAEFMRNPVSQPDTSKEVYISQVSSSSGEMWYCNQVFGTPALFPTMVSIRSETIYLKDDTLSDTLNFSNIISSNGFTFFPFDKVITKDISDDLKPYFIDAYVTCDPGDGHGIRKMQFEDITVTNATTEAARSVNASTIAPIVDDKGYITLSGGKSLNDSYGFNGKTLEYVLGQKIHASPIPADPSTTNGSYNPFYNIEYKLKINYDALATYSLITIGCFPSVQNDLAVNNVEFSKIFNFALPDFVTLPDVETALNGMSACLTNYRANMTLETTTTFGTCMLDIMNNLNTQAASSYCQLLQAAIDIFNSNILLNKDLQFVGKNIGITVSPMDLAGRTLLDMIGGFTPPKACTDEIASKFKGTATVGEVSSFSYDGYGNFIANLFSLDAGDGYLTVSFDGNTLKKTIRPADPSLSPSIIDYTLPYSFVGRIALDGYVPAVRRNETDTANNR